MIILPIQRAAHTVGLVLERRRVAATHAEAHLLAHLAEHAELSVRELQRRAVLRPSTLTAVIDRLESRELVRRRTNPRDRRSIVVRLTPRGRTAAGRVARAVADLDGRIRERVGADDVAAFTRVLAAIEAELT